MPPAVGVCSWSLRPESPGDLVARLRRTGCDAMQLHLDPMRTGRWALDDLRDRAAEAGIVILSGMMTMEGEDYTSLESIARTGGVRPDATWSANLDAAHGNARVAQALGLDLVTFHAGHLPESPDDPERDTMVARLRELVKVFGERGVRVGLETGQETAGTLEQYLDQIDGAGVNFDPANMILYGMGDPHDALERLAPRVVQIHIKDALPTDTPGAWGEEVRAGDGAVDWSRFMSIARRSTPSANLLIEREAGDTRVEDIVAARELIGGLIEGSP
ncbi:MAG: sugar phosphate isomerase/epimerase family protein [Phycisphaerales bacterium]